mgnify:CR=1 FL=1|jgi:hypothetical protein
MNQIHQDYNRCVNDKWTAAFAEEGASKNPSEQEAIAAVKRLYRKAMGRKLTMPIKITSGNRYTWPRRGVYYVNPTGNYIWAGWKHLVHDVSHYCHRRLHRQARPHSNSQLTIERVLTDYVIDNGWLHGKLKTQAKPKPPVDKVARRAVQVDANITRWEIKLKRAQAALKKYKVKQRYYQKKLQARAE